LEQASSNIKAEHFARIKQAYGVDVSNIEHGNLAKIFDQTSKHKQKAN